MKRAAVPLFGAHVLIACGGARGVGGIESGPGRAEVRLLVTVAAQASFYDVTPSGLRLERAVAVPTHVRAARWVGTDAAVLLEDPAAEPGAPTFGRVSPAGFQPLAVPVGSLWEPAEVREGLEPFDPPWWQLEVGADGATWAGRCAWGYHEDGGDCVEWVYARLGPAPLLTQPSAPEGPAVPPVAFTDAPADLTATIAVMASGEDDPDAAAEGGDDDAPALEPLRELRCQHGAVDLTWPDPDEYGSTVDVDEIEWLSSEPPIFRVWAWEDGLERARQPSWFEGCALSATLAGGTLVPGPDGYAVLFGSYRLVLVHDGRVIDALELPPADDYSAPSFGTVTFAASPS